MGDPFGKIPVTVDGKKDFEPYISVRPAFRMPIAGRPNVGFEAMDEMYDFVRDEVVLKLISTRRRAGLRRE